MSGNDSTAGGNVHLSGDGTGGERTCANKRLFTRGMHMRGVVGGLRHDKDSGVAEVVGSTISGTHVRTEAW